MALMRAIQISKPGGDFELVNREITLIIKNHDRPFNTY
jgi:hypothetical protein